MRLTKRECEILAGLLRCLKREAIAAELGISRHTVDFHLRHLRAKAGCRCSVELIVFFARRPDVLRSCDLLQLMLPI